MKKVQVQFIKVLAIMLVAIAFLAACSKSEPTGTEATNGTNAPKETKANEPAVTATKEQVTLEFWHAYGESEVAVLKDEVIPAFEKAFPLIKINSTTMPTENLKQQVITAVLGEVAPDLMRMDIAWVSEFAGKALLPLDDMENFNTIKDGLFPGPMQTNFFEGKYYGVPLDTNTKVNIYNKKELNALGFTEPPKTIDELVDLGRKAKAAGKTGITIGGANTWDMLGWFWTLGGQISDPAFKDAIGFLNSDASIKAMETILGWNEEGLLSPPILGGQPGTWEGLEAGQYVSINEGPWYFGGKDAAKQQLMIPAKMPAGPDGLSHSIVGGQDLVMFKDTKHAEAAWAFTQFLLSDEIQILMAVKAGVMPVNIKAGQSDELKNIYYFSAYMAELETAYPRTPSAQWGKMDQVISDAFEKIIRKTATAKEALDQAATEVDALLKQKNL